MKKITKILIIVLCCIMFNPIAVYATANTNPDDTNTNESNTNDNTNGNTNGSTNGTNSNNVSGSTGSNSQEEEEDPSEDDSEPEEPTPEVNSKIMLCDNWQIPTVTYGQKVNIVLPLVNMDQYDITDVIITPVVATDTASFPFEIEKTGYTVELTELLGSNYNSDPLERRQEVTYTFKARDDISSGYYELKFNAIFKNRNGTEETATISTYVKTIGKRGAGSNSNATSVPRVIVTGFTTSPENVKAGDDFTLTLHIKNTSDITGISNMKCDLEAAADGTDENAVTQAFLPKQGSSTIFLNRIGKGETKDISIEMNAKASLTQKPYVLNVKMEYEDELYNQYTSEANVSIPVLQAARFEISDPEVMPASIEVGSDSNVMFSIYNTGKTTMYNVSIKFDSKSVSGGDTYIGKIQTGETGNVDAMLSGKAASGDDGKVKILITYEDEAGKPTTVEKELNLTVTEQVELPDDIGVGPDDEEMQESSSSPFMLIITIVVTILVGVATVIAFVKLRKKKLMQLLEEELIADLDETYLEEDSIYDEDDVVNEEVSVEEATGEEELKDAPHKEGDDDEIS